MKIMIIGYSGAGKSTLAKKLSEVYGVDVLYLDTVHWLPGWKERTFAEKDAIVTDFMDVHAESGWVIDGNYSRTCYERRLSEADRIIFMAFNRFSCLWRAIKRNHQYKGRSRESITEGCDEKIDREFVWWILYKGRSGKVKKRYERVCREYADKVTIIKNQRQLERYINQYTKG